MNKKMKISVLVGTRPEIIKMQPVIKEIQKRELDFTFIHTGQHYDWNLSAIFFRELGLPDPNHYLNVGSDSHGTQTAKIIMKTEQILKKEKPNYLLIQGDTNSGLGGAIAAAKLNIIICHVEAGCRSFDKRMPEEINRVIISDLASIHFAPTETTVCNLLKEGINIENIFLTGHPIVDLIESQYEKILSSDILNQLKLKRRNYYLTTMHRAENIENKVKIKNILKTLNELSKKVKIIFPIHPHTKRCIEKYKLDNLLTNIDIIPPQSYFDMLNLIKNARIILTDSGGIQQEAAILKTPCITLRTTTEWVETINEKINFLVGSDPIKLHESIDFITKNRERILNHFNELGELYGKPGVSSQILDIIEAVVSPFSLK